MAAAAKTIDKWKRKKWFKIFAPNSFDKIEIAETPAEKPEQVLGRTIKVNVRSLTGQIKKSHIELVFRVNDVQGLNASTEIAGMQVKPETLRRIVRRRNSKIDLVQDSQTKDKKKAHFKTTIVTLKKIERKKKTIIRHKIREEVEKLAMEKNFEELVQEIIFGNALTAIFNSVKNIAGIKRIEIMSARQLKERH